MKKSYEIKDLNPKQAERTGVYVAGKESRYFKAGDQITRNYRFSHELHSTPAKAEKKG